MRNTSTIREIDWLTIGIYIALVIIGLVNIYASTYDLEQEHWINWSSNFGKQLSFAGVALVLGIFLLVIESNFYSTFAYVIYGFVILLLIITLLVAPEIKGSRSWLPLGPVNLQPSELAKFAVSLALAKFVSTMNVDIRELRDKLFAGLIIGAPALLILAQGDYGSALIFSVFLLVLYREGLESGYLWFSFYFIAISVFALVIPKFVFIGILAGITVLLFYLLRQQRNYWPALIVVFLVSTVYVFSIDFAFNNFLEDRHRDRINVLLGKSGNDWNVRQSKIAIGSGGFSGKGFLNGTQTQLNFVPEQSTDFIYSTIGEEWGFAGTFTVVVLFVLLITRLMRLANRQRSSFSRIFGYGVASLIFFNFFVNIAMTIGLFPVIGIPLPLVSYGGSSLLAYTLLIFTMLKLDAQRLMVLR